MRSNSQKAGCILRFPASHSCHPRRVQWISAAADVCESPAASRAARTCSGKGFAAGPFGPRFGWFAILCSLGAKFLVKLLDQAIVVAGAENIFKRFFDRRSVCNVGEDSCGDGGVDLVHFLLLPLFLPRRGGLRCATHELNYTRNACNVKKYFRKITEAVTAPHNAEITGRASGPG